MTDDEYLTTLTDTRDTALAIINAILKARQTGNWDDPTIPPGAKPNVPGGADHAGVYAQYRQTYLDACAELKEIPCRDVSRGVLFG